MLCADLFAYHCRGWEGSRLKMPKWAITQSMKNDWRVWNKHRSFLLPFSVFAFAYLLVKTMVVFVEIGLIRRMGLGK